MKFSIKAIKSKEVLKIFYLSSSKCLKNLNKICYYNHFLIMYRLCNKFYVFIHRYFLVMRIFKDI